MMRTLSLPLLLLIFFSEASAFQMGPSWKIIDDGPRSKVWLYTKDQEVSASYQELAFSKNVPRSTSERETYLQSVEKEKGDFLAFLGISDWTPRSHRWSHGDGSTELILDGTYRDVEGRLVDFSELHIFRPQMVLQGLFTRPHARTLPTQIKDDFLNRIRKPIKR